MSRLGREEMKARVNGIDIDYTDQGAGTPVILIHAYPLSKRMWEDQLSALRHHCRVVTLDLRGFGDSDTGPEPYSMDQMAADVRGLMSALEIDEATIVGLSMGGYVSLALYRQYPEVIRALVLADTRAAADTHEGRARRLKLAQKAEREGAAAIAEELIPSLLGRTTLESRAAVVERVREIIKANSPEGIAGAQRGMAGRRDSTYILPGIDFPVLIIVGAEDALIPIAEAEGFRDGIRGARLRVIAGAGHLSNLEQPDAFNGALIEFIDSVRGGTGQ